MASRPHAPLKAGVKDSARYNANIVFAEDLSPPEGPILTGIGFLDHMLDQFNSHAQIGLSVTISDFAGEESNVNNRNRHAKHDQAKLVSIIGSKVGTEFHRLLVNRGRHCKKSESDSKTSSSTSADAGSSRFVCPLDESLVVCILKPVATGNGQLVSYTLPPYGEFPAGTGRTKLGQLEMSQLELFWSNVAAHANLELSFRKVTGDNGHHIVEASFKAMARGLRNLLDGTNTTFPAHMTENSHAQQQAATLDALYGPTSQNFQQSIALKRHASICRKTKETNIQVSLQMNGGEHRPKNNTNNIPDDEAEESVIKVDTGIAVLDQFLYDLFSAAQIMTAQVVCKDGDLWIDEHHTVEDVAITLGQVLHKALGTKAGLNRMWCASTEQGDTKVEVVLDLSNRPMLCHNMTLGKKGPKEEHDGNDEMVGDLPVELFPHFLESFIVQARVTCHVCQIHTAGPSSTRDLLYCVATALGTALRYCCMVDSRRAGGTASSKGSLSV